VNLLVLLIGLRPWACSPRDSLARTLLAITVLSLEMQAVTWIRAGSLGGLVPVNAALAVVLGLVWRPARHQRSEAADSRLPWPVIVTLGMLALVLNLWRPLEGADPYHLDRVAQIERLGTLAFAPVADVKINLLAGVYELVLADLGTIPIVGPTVVRLHGAIGLTFYVVAVAAVREWLTGGARWVWAALFVVPVLFHQLVLVKNDLFGAVPGFVALCWLVARGDGAPGREYVWAGVLAGFSVAVKVTSAPLALVMPAVALGRRDRWTPLGCLALGGAVGAVAGGLAFTAVQSAAWYGDPLAPLAELGNRNTTLLDVLASVGRFAISLFDFGVLTRQWWPGRGGWGSTLGAPLVWAMALLAWRAPGTAIARRSLCVAAVYFVVLAAVYPDADLAHRLGLAPGLMLVACAAHLSDGPEPVSTWFRRMLWGVLAASGLQILRSATLYLYG
jgi:hypothetical protein